MSGYAALKHNILQNAAKDVIPAAVDFELTPRCNFSCPMCYLKSSVSIKEKATQWWKDTFKAAADAGLLYALLTGGEPLSRPDFIELYEYLYDLGVRITVYTNGSLIDGGVLQTFMKRPPEFVGITLYGYNEASVHAVTGNPKGFHDVETGIEMLAMVGIDVALRTIPIRPIYDHLDKLIAYVKNKDLRLGYQLYVGPGREKDLDAGLRITPAEIADFEVRIKDAFPIAERPLHQETTASTCPALRSGCFITWDGRMTPCAMVAHPGKIVNPDTFLTTFRE
ncbi:MAG: radical SAM protein, partial [Bacillota bacterium]|nr:radical SAM protein [Bacillota bacterium]